jgi:chitin disaccharide deacetylase
VASKRRAVVLCADDFGMSEGVSAGILRLVDQGRISATSVMTNGPAWRRFAPDLQDRAGPIGVGLHFNLTSGAPLGAMPQWANRGRLLPIGSAIRKTLGPGAPLDEVEAEFERQLSAFQDAFGREPDFVDGHQHVHALPRIRDRILKVLTRRNTARRPWLRDPSGAFVGNGPSILPKVLMVRALSLGFRHAAQRAGFETNDGFSGFSAFDRDPDVAAMFERAFIRLGPRHVVMCHPGRPESDPDSSDEVVESRPRELAYLQSPGFADLLQQRSVELVPCPGGQIETGGVPEPPPFRP